MRRRPLCALALLVLAAAPARAQSDWSRIAVPSYRAEDLVAGAYRHWYLPRAGEFQAQAAALVEAVAGWCAAAPDGSPALLEAARRQWTASMVAWERLSAVAVGPLLQRRSTRQIDFMPTRPSAIEHAIRTAPAGAAAMELVGTPAKGLPALEWLLWTRPAAPGSPACRYALEVARDVAREADALQQAFAQLAGAVRGEEAAAEAFGELVNQWAGAVERLRWQQIDKPLQSAGRAAPEFPRGAAGASAAAWEAQWSAIRGLAVLPPGRPAPVPGTAVLPLESHLRGRGLNPAADRLVRTVRDADRALQGLAPADRPRLQAAVRALAALKRLVEEDTAPALQVGLGFSDADGD